MKITDLPTNETFDEYSWACVLDSGDSTSTTYIDATAYEIITQADKGIVTAGRISRVDAWWASSEEGYADTDVVVLAEAVDGWLTLVAWCDTTGWDCQSGGRWHWAATREDAIRNGLDNEARARLGFTADGGAA